MVACVLNVQFDGKFIATSKCCALEQGHNLVKKVKVGSV